MREKTNTIIKTVTIIMLISICSLLASIVLLGVFSWTSLKELFLNLLFITLMSTGYSFFAFIFFLLIFADSKTSYTADLINVPQEFENIYETLYEKYIVELEKIRKRIKFRTILGKILLGIMILYIFATNQIRTFLQQYDLIIYLIAMFLIVIELILYKDNKADKFLYRNTYKKYVIKELINILNYNVTYEPENPNKNSYYEEKYIDANFFLNIAEFYAEDFIEGEIDNCPIKISDVTVKRSSGKYRTVFEGIFAFVDYNKHIMSNVVISRTFLLNNDGKTKVDVNNDEFNKRFNVYAQNESYAQRLLNDGLLEVLLKFRNKYYLDFDVALINGKIYIKIYSFNVFEPEIFDKTNGKQDLYTHYCFSKFILDLAKEIKEIIDRN